MLEPIYDVMSDVIFLAGYR